MWCVLGGIFPFSCRYHFDSAHQESFASRTISIPYIEGDVNCVLSDELVKAIATSGIYRYTSCGGELELKVMVIEEKRVPIGWKYQKEVSGKLKDELIGTEARLEMLATVSLVHRSTGDSIWGPISFSSSIDYDYYEPDCIEDLSFVMPPYGRQTSVQFSLGQLDSFEGAHTGATSFLSKELAKKIVKQLIRRGSIEAE